MKRVLCYIVVLCSILLSLPVGASSLVSPRLNGNVVEIEITLPHAQEVMLCADWLTSPVPMNEGENGRRYYRSDVLAPGLYTYTLRVDGVSIIGKSKNR